MKLKLDDLKVHSFVTGKNAAATIKGGVFEKPIVRFTQIPCSAIDACPSAWICGDTEVYCLG